MFQVVYIEIHEQALNAMIHHLGIHTVEDVNAAGAYVPLPGPGSRMKSATEWPQYIATTKKG